jgi:hypothetical protein
MNRLLSIGEAFETLGVSITMLRRYGVGKKSDELKQNIIVGGHHVDSA